MTDSKERKKFGLSKGEYLKGSFGEIFITNKMRFIFHCSICREKLNTMIAFKKHMSSKHSSTFDELDENPLEFKMEPGNVNEQDENNFLHDDPLGQNAIKLENTNTEEVLTNDKQPQKHMPLRSDDNKAKIVTALETCEILTKEDCSFSCNQCDKEFASKHSLALHKRKHSHKSKFPCTECKKKFLGKKELNMHLLWHKGKKPYLCSWCGNGYRSIRSVNLHERVHTNYRPYKCPYCPKEFYRNKQYNEHIVIHTQKRAHVCDICNSTFPRRKALQSHMKIHENKREHVCNICQTAYNQRPALYFHMKSKHNLLPNKPAT